MANIISFTERLAERRAEEVRGEEERRREIQRQKNEKLRLQKEEKRRAAGVIPRDEYEGNSLSRHKPWESEGVSRATWYRRQQHQQREA